MTSAKIRQFWDWFAARADRVRQDPARHQPEISEMIHRLHADLSWEMGVAAEGGSEFVVRTDHTELRLFAGSVVRAAPRMPGWIIREWRQPSTILDAELQLGGRRALRFDECSADLTPRADFPLLDLTLVSPHFVGRKDWTVPGFLILDHVLGEKLVTDGLLSVEFRAGRPGGVPIARLRDEVTRLLSEVRARPSSGDDRWASLEGRDGGKPLVILMATGLDPSRMPGHPWRIDVRLRLKNPHRLGVILPEELEVVQALEDRLISFLGERASTLVWTHRTSRGIRTTSAYVDDPERLASELGPWLSASGYEAEIIFDYDPRWKEYRSFLPKG